jgi:hypothetical protein
VSADFDDFIATYPDAVRKVASKLRMLILATLPEPLEMVDRSSKVVGYGFGPRYADMVCTIIPGKTGVKLGLAYGASLADPQRLLEGRGKLHRHLSFATRADLRRAGVKPLLKAALAAQQSRQGRP